MVTNGDSRTPLPLGVVLDQASIAPLHRRFWLVAALGVILDGFDFFIIGVANPLIAKDLGGSAADRGLLSAAAIVGAMFGAALLGPLGDRVGRSKIFRIDLWLFVVFSVACTFAWNLWALIAFRFLLGIAVGLDYPIAASYLAEILPARQRGRWLVGAFSLQAAGIIVGAVVGVVVLTVWPAVGAWRIMLGFGALLALLIIWLRRNVPESPRWLAQNGREAEATAIAERMTGVACRVTDKDRARPQMPREGWNALVQPQLFRRPLLRLTVFTSVPWFLMDIATYAVGIFTPTLLAGLALAGPNATFLADDISSTEGTAFLDVFLVVGFALAIALVDRVGRIRLQLVGFAVMTVALCLLAFADQLPGGGNTHLPLVFVGFALFNTFMNLGPNATTFTLPAEVFPADVRAAGHGFAAGFGKLGAAVGTFLFPVLLASVGTTPLLYGAATTSALAFLVTWTLRVETRGRSLDELSGLEAASVSPRITPP
ncbi:MFS transporter [Streptomyces sp. NPDC088736]|uniref:MFS transporter n=1 Tax=Streptomyces sp. NPDC088736 TaxID=3365881 RepID=UPI003823DADF